MVGYARGWTCPPVWLGFALAAAVWWPLGLVGLAIFLGSRAMCGWGHHSHGGREAWGRHFEEHRQRWRERRGYGRRSSGNVAFDDYRDALLRRLEEDQRDFQAFLEKLRRAKDQKQFDEFLADRESHRQHDEPRPS
ncbi:DUF2852 domain-containing protein [Roseiterribacter gracilis]|uniref:DUF2852 domain-containing protein n=1 Tax=Roseiterribacter gracilis TaxID=2812848 RepID=A0A8S8X6T9_9PROT|nr:hypothetical protein TMPK1_09000 [Rhodospirillales bacterium TMPK1]